MMEHYCDNKATTHSCDLLLRNEKKSITIIKRFYSMRPSIINYSAEIRERERESMDNKGFMSPT
jgi:hypothetical protein